MQNLQKKNFTHVPKAILYNFPPTQFLDLEILT